jgi:predicted phage terminase large subunit-like protein
MTEKTLKLMRGDYPSFLEWLKTLSAAEEITLLRRMCRTDLFFLTRYAMRRKDVDDDWLFDRSREVQESPDGHLDLWAREHYKSTWITWAYSIMRILRTHGDDALTDRECTIGIFSHTRPISKGFLRQIKNELANNEFLKMLFPDILYADPEKEAPKWSEDDGIIVKRKGNPKESTVEAWGVVDGQPTSKHFTDLVYDDIVTLESIRTPEGMAKTLGALETSYNLGAHGGVKRFIGTRYHYNDAYRTVMERGTAKARIYPATTTGDMEGEPVYLSRATLEEKRRDMGSFTFACQMLQNPKSDEAQGFKREWLKERSSDVTWNGMNVYLLFDPASAKKKTSDYTAAWAIGLSSDKNFYVLDMVRDRLSLPQRTKLMLDWHRKFRPMQTRYEKYGKDSDIEHIKGEQARQNYRFEITQVHGITSKPDRIKRLIPYFEQGRFVLPRTHHYTQYDGKTVDLAHDFIELEYLGFPVGAHDDMLDALARLFEPDLPLIWPMPKKKAVSGDRRGRQGWEEA